ncbi:MAG: FAD-dependent oxidoreductase, partial [Waterburya sp.]
ANPEQPLSIAIIGGGAGGVELALNMQTCLRKILKKNNPPEIYLIHRGKQLLSGHNDWVSQKLTKIMQQRGIKLHLQQHVKEVLPGQIICQSGLKIVASNIFWVTQATVPSWIKESKLKTDDQGFILVADTLQSISHPHIFAAGDIATMVNYQRPKAGVFAVRQGQPLFNNWQNILSQQPLESYLPQDKYLALIGTGDQKAIASWGSFGGCSTLCWWLKEYIDRKFMNQFINLNL